jgi:predicted site-specific integrase-resolvase
MSYREPELPAVELAGGMRFSAWCKTIGICKRTGTRWRDAGKVQTIWRNGVEFVTAAAIKNFFEDDGTRNTRGLAAVKAQQRRALAGAPRSHSPAALA